MSCMQMSLQQIAKTLASPFVQIGTAYGKAAQKRPFAVGFVTTGLKTSAADLFAQTVRCKPWQGVPKQCMLQTHCALSKQLGA